LLISHRKTGKKLRGANGKLMTMKGHAHIGVEIYKGWEVIFCAGGPGADVNQPIYYGHLKSRQIENHDIYTRTFPTLRKVRRSIDAFQESPFGEDEKKVMVEA
jgi:hypothetical protein